MKCSHRAPITLREREPAFGVRITSRPPGFKAEEIKQLLDVPRVLTIADDLSAVNRSINQARTLRQAASNSEVLNDIGSLIFELLGEYPIKPETNHRSSLARFFGRQKK